MMSLKTEDMTTSPALDAEIKLPKKLFVTKLVTYDVSVIVELMKEQGLEDLELDDVVAWLEDELIGEFNARLKELTFEDDFGQEVYGATWGTR
jgi:hypothetical protein